jgi:CRP-like cAMP-binding protein
MSELALLADQPAKPDWLGRVFAREDDTGCDDFLATVRKHARPVPAGTEIMFEGDRVCSVTWVLKGWVGLSKILDDGRRQLIDVVLPVDLVVATTANGFSSPYGITALTDAVTAPCSLARLVRQRTEFEALGRIIDRLTAAALARQAERMLRLGQGTACERVAHALLEVFLRLEAIDQTAGSRFRLPVTQRDFGDLTGLTSVHVCRTLRRLMRDGVIDYVGQEITIRDIDRLAKIARVDMDAFREEIIPTAL